MFVDVLLLLKDKVKIPNFYASVDGGGDDAVLFTSDCNIKDTNGLLWFGRYQVILFPQFSESVR